MGNLAVELLERAEAAQFLQGHFQIQRVARGGVGKQQADLFLVQGLGGDGRDCADDGEALGIGQRADFEGVGLAVARIDDCLMHFAARVSVETDDGAQLVAQGEPITDTVICLAVRTGMLERLDAKIGH